MKVIVYTRAAGQVSVCRPTPWIMQAMCHGGIWDKEPRGFVERQIELQIAHGIAASVAQRFARAMCEGGCTEAEAYEIIRDRDCAPRGSGMELWDDRDLPGRWFRDAWRRSANGGPIHIDLAAAKKIQVRRAMMFVDEINRRRRNEIDDDMPLLEVDWEEFRARVRNVKSLAELVLVWPCVNCC